MMQTLLGGGFKSYLQLVFPSFFVGLEVHPIFIPI